MNSKDSIRLMYWSATIGALAAVGCLPAPPATSSASSSSGEEAWVLPVRYQADLILVAPVTEGGDTLELYTDTGGGANMFWADAAGRLGLVVRRVAVGRDTVSLASLPPLARSAAIPLPADPPPVANRLLVVPASASRFGRDGFLGRMWFADRVWVFDYRRQSLTLLPNRVARHDQMASRVPLGFLRDSAGKRMTHFPRIRVAVDGDSLDLLFDTGARVSLSDSARATLTAWQVGGPAQRGTSFIAQTVFEGWRTRHPDWRVIERADVTFATAMPMIEVPQVAIAGHEVGPVWFTMRSSPSFRSMSEKMDRSIVGALGGSALKYFRITIDYPNATATFERP